MRTADPPRPIAFIILSGRPTPVGVIRQAIDQLGTDSSQLVDGTLNLRVGGAAIAVFGIPDRDDDVSERLFLRVQKPTAAVKRLTAQLAASLDWQAEIRWGIGTNVMISPPKLDALLEASRIRNSPSKRWRPHVADLIGTLCLIVLCRLELVPLEHDFQRTNIAVVMAIACAISIMFYYYCFYRLRAVYDKLSPWLISSWLSAFVLYSILHPLGALASWGRIAISVASIVAVLTILLLLLKRAQKKGLTRSQEVQAAWLRATLQLEVLRAKMTMQACLVCGAELPSAESCRCDQCGTANYYLSDRADARELASEHGAVFQT